MVWFYTRGVERRSCENPARGRRQSIRAGNPRTRKTHVERFADLPKLMAREHQLLTAEGAGLKECGQRLRGRGPRSSLTLERWKGCPQNQPVRRCSPLRRSACSLAHSCAAAADSTVALRTIWPSWRTETRLMAPFISSSHSRSDARHRRIKEVPIRPTRGSQ